MKLLITGGAGYIGSHFVNKFKNASQEINVVDNFRESDKNIIKSPNIHYHNVDLRDSDGLRRIFDGDIDAVVHFAALASVPDSVKNPLEYYDNNVVGGLNLLKIMRENKVKKIIFSCCRDTQRHLRKRFKVVN